MKKKYTGMLGIIFLCVLSALFLFPVVITLTNSLMSENEIAVHYATTPSIFQALEGVKKNFVDMKLIPEQVSIEQYQTVLVDQPTFLLLLINSVKITVPVVFFNCIVSLLAAYGFTVWQFKYKEAVFFIYITVMLMPLQAVIVPNYIVADLLHLKESYLAIILPGIFAPFGTFLLRQSMKSLPAEYYEAARMDGAGNWKIFLHIVVPQMKSGLSALVMLVFIEYWNLVDQAVIFIKDYYREPLSVFLSRIAGSRAGVVFAASAIYLVVPLWLVAAGQKDLEKGIELSGVK